MDKEERIERIKSLLNELKELYGAESVHLFVDYDYCDCIGGIDEYVIRIKNCKIHTDGSPVDVNYNDQAITIE